MSRKKKDILWREHEFFEKKRVCNFFTQIEISSESFIVFSYFTDVFSKFDFDKLKNSFLQVFQLYIEEKFTFYGASTHILKTLFLNFLTRIEISKNNFLFFLYVRDLFCLSEFKNPEVISVVHLLVVSRKKMPHLAQAHTFLKNYLSTYLTITRFQTLVFHLFLIAQTYFCSSFDQLKELFVAHM